MSLKNDAASVVGDPEWLPSRWDRQANTLQFVHLSRADHDSVTFLGDEYLAKLEPASVTLGLPEIAAANAARPPSPHYIFHSAFCCSTLLARALDLPGTAMALKEPQILNTVTQAARAKALSREVLQLIVGLLARPFGASERVIISRAMSSTCWRPDCWKSTQARCHLPLCALATLPPLSGGQRPVRARLGANGVRTLRSDTG